MTDRPPLLIIGTLPPSTSAAAAQTVQTTLALSDVFEVIVAVSNCAALKPSDLPFKTVHARTLHSHWEKYKNHHRLYILSDNYESLFALELYHHAPGPVMMADGKLNRLSKDFCQCQPEWPVNYGNWLRDTFGEPGDIIARGLVHHRRLSNQLIDELPPITEVSETVSPDAAKIARKHILNVPPLFSPLPPVPENARADCRAAMALSKSEILVVHTASSAASEMVETFKRLGNTAADHNREIHFKEVSQGEAELTSLVAAADIILVTDASTQCPPLAAAALSQHKPLVTCSQHWSHSLPSDGCLQLLHQSALHQMVAAVGALASNASLRSWYSTNLRRTFPKDHFASSLHVLTTKLLAAPAQPKMPTTDQQRPPLDDDARKTTDQAALSRTAHFPSGKPRSVALIGAVPPRPLIERLFPEVNWLTSPRFATAELSSVLCFDRPEYAANKLALLGYDTPLIATMQQTGANANVQEWLSVRADLKATDEALTFGCVVEGAASADAILGALDNGDYALDLVFRRSESPKILAHYEENCGLFWHLDPVRHQINCMLVAGVCGQYRINLKTSKVAFVVADAWQSCTLSSSDPALIRSDNHGVLSFTLAAVAHNDLRPLSHEILTKTLAESDLNLEWLNHG